MITEEQTNIGIRITVVEKNLMGDILKPQLDN